MVTALVTQSDGIPKIVFEGEIAEATSALRAFLFDHVYRNSAAKAEEEKAKALLVTLYEYFVAHPDEMPELYCRRIPVDGTGRCVSDYISGMTDRYAIRTYEKLFVPEVWRGSNV